jgi:hypothetical protein
MKNTMMTSSSNRTISGPQMQDHNKMLFLNVGWMTRYQGPSLDDPTIGGFGFLADRTHGHECYNFTDQAGFLFGNHPSGSGTNLQKLGAPHGADSVSNIDVVWFSKHPNSNRAVIIGWYLNATVFSSFKTPAHNKAYRLEGEKIGYKVTARTTDCTLLPVEDRLFPIPGGAKTKGGYGQNVNWYGTDDFFRSAVASYIDNWRTYRTPRTSTATSPRNDDSERRRLVEAAAIATATAYYESPSGGSRSVLSVEMQYKGWDLEAKGAHDTLLVEVKGLAGSAAVIELTPNEYSQMQAYSSDWILFIVTNCLTPSPVSIEARYDDHSDSWRTSSGQVVVVTPRIGAVINASASPF